MSKIVKFDPFAEMQALQRQFFADDLLTPNMSSLSLPATDVYMEDDTHLVVEAHLPHFDEKDIDMSVDGDVLIIQAQRHEKEKDKSKKYVVRESSSSLYRQIRLPDTADKDAIEADLKDGLLKVTVPLKSLPAPKKIMIGKK